MKKFKYFILPFLAILGVFNVKAYNFTGISKGSRTELGLYYDNTRVLQVSCTSSNDGFCGLEDSDLPNSSNTYNNVFFASRDTLNQNFTSGTQYKFSFYFYQYTPGYFLRSSDITMVTGATWQNFTNWTSNDMTIISYTLNLLETDSNVALYRLDVVSIPTTSNVAGFYFKVYQDYESISNNNNSYMEMTRYLSISQLSPGQIDYSQDFNQVNTNINNLGDTITNNQNSNTQDIIDNQNQNTQQQIESQEVCRTIDKQSIEIYNKALNSSGNEVNSSVAGITNYINIDKAKIKTIQNLSQQDNKYLCFYNINKVKINCINTETTINEYIIIPTNATYVRFTIRTDQNRPQYQICKNGNQSITDSITDTNVSDAQNDASNFFSSFTESDHGGLSAIVTAPLVVVNSMLTNNSCSDLRFQVMGADVTFPSGCILWNLADNNIVTIWHTIVCGFISYVLLKKLFKDIENLKNPGDQEVSTLDL